jgi:hypothetical protein
MNDGVPRRRVFSLKILLLPETFNRRTRMRFLFPLFLPIVRRRAGSNPRFFFSGSTWSTGWLCEGSTTLVVVDLEELGDIQEKSIPKITHPGDLHHKAVPINTCPQVHCSLSDFEVGG